MSRQTEKSSRDQGRVFVLLVQRYWPAPPGLTAEVFITSDSAHRQAADLLNEERRRLGLAMDATPDNWSLVLDQMRCAQVRRQHGDADLGVDIAVHSTPLRR